MYPTAGFTPPTLETLVQFTSPTLHEELMIAWSIEYVLALKMVSVANTALNHHSIHSPTLETLNSPKQEPFKW